MSLRFHTSKTKYFVLIYKDTAMCRIHLFQNMYWILICPLLQGLHKWFYNLNLLIEMHICKLIGSNLNHGLFLLHLISPRKLKDVLKLAFLVWSSLFLKFTQVTFVRFYFIKTTLTGWCSHNINSFQERWPWKLLKFIILKYRCQRL